MSSRDQIKTYRKQIRDNLSVVVFFAVLLVVLSAIFAALIGIMSKDPQISDPMAWPLMLMMLMVLGAPILLVLSVMRNRTQNIAESRAQIKALRQRGEAQEGSLSIASIAGQEGALSESRVGALEMDEQAHFDFDEQEAHVAAPAESMHHSSS